MKQRSHGVGGESIARQRPLRTRWDEGLRAWRLVGEDGGDAVSLSTSPQLSTPRNHSEIGIDVFRESRAVRMENIARATGSRDGWHAARARGLRRRIGSVLDGCGRWRKGVVRCSGGCEGQGGAIPDLCKARALCEACAADWAKRLRRRLLRAGVFQEHLRAATRRAREKQLRSTPRWSMMTLTVRHSGDVGADRERIAAGWRRLRSWLHERQGSNAFVLVWEITPGADGVGHVHAHVLIPLVWLDYAELRAAWSRATNGHGERIHVAQGKYGRDGAGGAAAYIAKYASKGSVSLGESHAVAAAWYRATYAKRWCSTSVRWWLVEPPKHCRCCGASWEVVLDRGEPVEMEKRVDARGSPG